MSRETGKSIYDVGHLKFCIIDILTTPLGSRVMRRDYGSNLFNLIDQPMTPATVLAIYAAVIGALGKWEPRIQVTKVTLDETDYNNGHLSFMIEGYYLLQNRFLRIDKITLDFYKDPRYSSPA